MIDQNTAITDFTRRPGVPATCHDCLHWRYGTCGICSNRQRKYREIVEDRENGQRV